MTFESEPGLGTTFHLFLPASTRTADKGQSLAAPTHRGEGTILVMDDEHFLRELVGFMLQSMGYAVVMASNGEEALRLCEQAEREGSDMRAAILDLTIHGGMGGRETARIMHERYPYLPIFASSGYSEDPVMSSPADFGFAGSIRKPFMKDELTQLLESCLHRS
jgi:CheY-like chemotaxis protein